VEITLWRGEEEKRDEPEEPGGARWLVLSDRMIPFPPDILFPVEIVEFVQC